MTEAIEQWRVDFDAEVEFSNGGALQAQGFRLDIPENDIGDDELGELFAHHLGLLMVGTTRILRKELIMEPHKGSRGVARAAQRRRVVELSGLDGLPLAAADTTLLADLDGVLVRLLGIRTETISRGELAALDVTDRAVLLHTGGQARLGDEAAAWLVEQRAALVGVDTAEHPALDVLVTAGIPVVTGLSNLEALPPNGFRIHTVPFPDSSRARVYGVVADA